jgi:hypothetical protein
MQNPTMSWIPKLKRTLPGFQRSFTHPQVVDGLSVTIFGRQRSCWKLCPGQIAASKENKICGGSDGILPLSWIQKSWKTLPAFHRLLIQCHLTNRVEITEFCALTTLPKPVWGRTAAEQNWTFGPRIDWNSRSPKYHYGRKLYRLSDGP